uniref:Venom peptide 5 n=1 Tax=Eumenes pomiformis TaxID=693051 RepID=VP5_EUMPO|nr:RecName: Full=Venom peptide 5; Short=EpVP5; Short=VP5; Flags: Precursor [Eumenes pomiformis]ACZ37398.1 VP5 protein precursor [Eumenes pomiformis]
MKTASFILSFVVLLIVIITWIGEVSAVSEPEPVAKATAHAAAVHVPPICSHRECRK